MVYTFNILQFYVRYTSIKLIFKKYSRVVDYNKLFEKNKNNFILQVLLELRVVFTMDLYIRLWEESREISEDCELTFDFFIVDYIFLF